MDIREPATTTYLYTSVEGEVRVEWVNYRKTGVVYQGVRLCHRVYLVRIAPYPLRVLYNLNSDYFLFRKHELLGTYRQLMAYITSKALEEDLSRAYGPLKQHSVSSSIISTVHSIATPVPIPCTAFPFSCCRWAARGCISLQPFWGDCGTGNDDGAQ
ncbi:hypothetical protein WG66_005558 [Moniliophthora roreri]|nr:vacuolar protein sorting-associated protein 29 [Moniliophthora roreri]KAI3618099.1 hypothetical protein WG66_005558 [Moniliophthora roreri]